MSSSYLDYPVENLSTLVIAIVGLLLIGLLIDWIRKKTGRYPKSV